MSKLIHLSSALPGDAVVNGLDEFAEALANDPEGTTITAIVTFDSPGFRYIAKENRRVPTVQVRRVEAWLTEDTPDEVRNAMAQRGEDRLHRAPLPFGVLEGDGGE